MSAYRYVKHGAWTWVYQGDEVWALSPECVAALRTRWVLKDYGPGWHLTGAICGGPVGPEHESMIAAAEYARIRLNEFALTRQQELQAQIEAIEAVLCS